MVKTIRVFTAVDSSIEKSDSFPNQALSGDLDKARSWEFKSPGLELPFYTSLVVVL